MSVWEAIVLGVIQGLTEFLPVSSSGHLELANYLFGIEEPNNMQFTVAVHGGTVLSTIVVFAREIGRLARGFFRFRMNDEMIFMINIFISMIPLLFVGIVFGDKIKNLFESNLLLVGSMLLVTACLLTFSHFAKPGVRKITPKSAFIIGLAQAAAIFPGLSRSGTTISAGLMQGIKREEVSKFSFLMVLIPIIGMNLLQVLQHTGNEHSVGSTELLCGFAAAFICGVVACKLMIRLVNRGKMIWFAAYCTIVGVSSIVYYLIASQA